MSLRYELSGEKTKLQLSEHPRFGSLVGSSVAARLSFALMERAAASDVTVLLEGETGTGKSQAAESIHRQSSRRDHPFLVVDCGALPPNLLESELFGHEKGAFTGAVTRRVGVFEEARGGTVFLDEIGELPLELQPKLLRVLEAREIRRLGYNTLHPGGRPDRHRHQPRPPRRGERRPLPVRPLLPPGGGEDSLAAARASGRRTSRPSWRSCSAGSARTRG